MENIQLMTIVPQRLPSLTFLCNFQGSDGHDIEVKVTFSSPTCDLCGFHARDVMREREKKHRSSTQGPPLYVAP